MTVDPPSRIVDWLRAARAGDAAARNELLGACRGFLAVVARAQLDRRLQARVDASDVVQQSLLDAHNGLDDFRGGTRLRRSGWRGWDASRPVTRSTRPAGIAKPPKREPAREKAFEVGSGADALAPRARDPSLRKRWRGLERELRVAAALERLPEDYREVVLLRNIERLPFDEVAARMSRSRGACQMLWLRAMEHLRDALRELS